MKKEKFEKLIHLIRGVAIITSAICTVLIYALSQSAAFTIFAGTGFLILLLCVYAVHKLDDKYISGIISDLSKLTDVLTELEDKKIFPENEDTIVSKLQSKIIKLARILKQKNESAFQEQENIKALVSDISHQLKTPIANLVMYSEFLENENLSVEKRKEYTGIIRLSINRLNFLSESMIKISRLESGLIHPDMHNQSLNETVLKAVKDVYSKAKKKNTEIVYSEERRILLPHDRNWTSEAVFNLLDNAVKYSQVGAKIYLSVKLYGMFAAVEVRDENEPISEGERSKIFTRFYRGSNSQNSEGIGVGLYLAREIVIKQGGYMNLKVNEQGNTFSLVLYM